MKGYILAAGEGTRMRPLTANTPKPLLPVAGKPFIVHTIDALKANGITDIVLLVGWQGRAIREHLRDGRALGVRIAYIEQEERLGTAHAVGMAKDVLNEQFVCINGDVIAGPETIRGLIALCGSKGASAMTVTPVPNPRQFGVIVVEDGMVREIHEKPEVPPSNLANAGIYMFRPSIFDAIARTTLSKRGEYELTDSLEIIAATEGVCAYEMKEEWIDVGRPWDLLRANGILMLRYDYQIKGKVEEGATLEGKVAVGEGSVVRRGAYVIGPTIIGNGCDIGPNCYVRPSTYLADGTKVGNGCEVKNTIVMEGSHVPHLNYVGDSIIGRRCNLGAGTKVANLRLDGRNIRATVKGEKVDTGLRKLGVIMGDDVKTGINASINVGTVISEGCFVGPGASVSGFMSPNSRVY
ncbi:MAG: NTP transferase domain-containing protein [Euryarchaeota archaeon]|nr:NTP transferase domain-containing protein [Euryarchaeota archaeon]